jgi:hypothetical protein
MPNDIQKADQETCAHIWTANSGQGGSPRFVPNRMMSAEPLMHVMCCECGVRTWFTEKRWYAMDEAKDSNAANGS